MIRFIAVLSIIMWLTSCVLEQDESLEDLDFDKGKVLLADPYILVYDGEYYAYGTSGNRDFHVYISSDLEYWERCQMPVLRNEDSFGEKSFWAPEVYFDDVNKQFIMYYSSEMYLCVATSDSPLGPFIQESKTPLWSNYWGIDPTLYRENGVDYLFFSMVTDKNYIRVAPMKSVVSMLDSNINTALEISQHWEGKQTIEGPCIFKLKDRYIMTYSGNDFMSVDYGIGYASADNIMGPWTKYDGNPIFRYPQYKGTHLEGVGHNSVFTDLDGNLRIVFHAHSASGYLGGRYMYIATLETHDTEPYITVADDIFPARLISEKPESSGATNKK